MARLNEVQKRELCSLIASRVATLHIIEHFLKNHELEITPQQVYSYKSGFNSKKWVDLIDDFRIKYDDAVDECYFSSKRNRMNALYTAYLVAEAKKDAKGMVLAVAQAHKEMEGTKIALVDKDGEDFSFTINIGPPPEEQEPKKVGPTLTLLPSSGTKKRDDDEEED